MAHPGGWSRPPCSRDIGLVLLWLPSPVPDSLADDRVVSPVTVGVVVALGFTHVVVSPVVNPVEGGLPALGTRPSGDGLPATVCELDTASLGAPVRQLADAVPSAVGSVVDPSPLAWWTLSGAPLSDPHGYASCRWRISACQCRVRCSHMRGLACVCGSVSPWSTGPSAGRSSWTMPAR